MPCKNLRRNGALNKAIRSIPGKTIVRNLQPKAINIKIRKIIYTTNGIESLNSGVRKYTKTKTAFPDDQSALKAVYLEVNSTQKKRIIPIRYWGININHFIVKFVDRCRI